jgi:hypothetical protein
MNWTRYFLLICIGLLALSFAQAEVVRLEVSQRLDMGKTGYEELIGRLHFEIDPKLPDNAVIADIALAPLNEAGKVSFSADLRILKPKDSARSNGAAWVEIPNRGGKAGLSSWITQHGFTVLNVGWEFDVPKQANKLRIEVPTARNADGSAVRGIVRATFTVDKRVDEFLLTDLESYPPVDVLGADSRLVVRTRAAYPDGEEVARDLWSLDGQWMVLKGGFEPGRTYDVSYLAEAPPVAGLGYAAIRDAVAWLKYDADSPAPVKQAYAFGSSQCGRFLRDFLYLGFNSDEKQRAAFEGVISHIAGAGRLVLNRRWATPRSQATFYTASFPFADSAQTDPVSGHADGILDNTRTRHVPKVFYINTATEYWGGGRVAALTHTDPAGRQDIAFPANVRSYYYAGTQHGAAGFPPTSQVAGSPLGNPVNASPVTTALRLALHRWVTESLEPPASVYPKLADGTLVPVTEVRFPQVPGMGDPRALKAGPRLSNPLYADGAGAGTELPLLVPQVDADGNDVSGIIMPDVAVPLGTATGWVFRVPSQGSPHELVPLRGAWVPFAVTPEQCKKLNDQRAAISERYESKEAYLARAEGVLQRHIDQGLLLAEDKEAQMRQCSERWDWVQKSGKD